jgi:hypothetical protein
VERTELLVDANDAVDGSEAVLLRGPLVHDDGHELLEQEARTFVDLGPELVHRTRGRLRNGALDGLLDAARTGVFELGSDAPE